jgi:hypothetical protein
MSGIVGHTTYGVLALREAWKRKLRTAPLATRHYSSFLAGAYLGSDIQTMPSVVCTATGAEAGYGGLPYAGCPGDDSRPWKLAFEKAEYLPRQIHEMFYGRAHLIFGWTKQEQSQRIPWDRLPEYFAACLQDVFDVYGPSERTLAYLLDWTVHVVSDSLIKSQQPGLTLKLLDGTYTPRNRPVQDLFAFHEIGLKELRLDWAALFADIAATPVEPAQAHYMRVAEPRGQLAKHFPAHWRPEQKPLLLAVLQENRRWARRHFVDEIAEMRLVRNSKGELDAAPSVVQKTGLHLAEMMDAAREAKLREQIGVIANECASLIEAIEKRLPRLQSLSTVPF